MIKIDGIFGSGAVGRRRISDLNREWERLRVAKTLPKTVRDTLSLISRL